MHSNPLSEDQLAVTAASMAGDAGRLYRIVSRLVDDGASFDSVLFDVLLPAESDLGSRWQDGDYLVSEEHVATATIETVISLLAGAFDQPDDGTHVVVAVAEGDAHSLGSRALAAYLLFLGFRTTFLGANVLAADLREYLESEDPDALILSCTLPGQLVGARAMIKAAHEAGVPVIAGGRAFGASGERAWEIGADSWLRTPREVPETLQTWAPDTSATEELARDPDEELTDLLLRRSMVTAMAQTALAEDTGPDPDVRLNSEIDLLLGAVEGAMLVGDLSLITETLGWQADMLHAHGYTVGDAVRTALHQALATSWPRAAGLLEQTSPSA
ncbi:MAG: cobalamin B12-binding domain-containing protein [Acidimicrobiia bacterium]